MADVPYSELRGGTGVSSDNPLLNVINAARDAACSLYRGNPGLFNTGRTIPGFGAVVEAQNAIYDNMCSDLGPLPPRPEKSFTGGQCPGTTYRVTYTTQIGPNPPSNSTLFREGPIGSPGFRDLPGGVQSLGFTYGTANPQLYQAILSTGGGGSTNEPSTWKLTNFSVFAISGPDNCGDPGASYPPVGSPSTDFRGTKDVKGPGGVITPTPWSIPPIAVVPVGPIVFSPVVRIDIGELKVVFDLRGASILPITINTPFTIGGGKGSNNPNPGEGLPPGLDGEALADRFKRLEDLLKELQDCACPKAKPLQVGQLADRSNSGIIQNLAVDRNKFMAISVTRSPLNKKFQEGADAPDVLYCGWAWFSSPQGYMSERMPIDAAGKVFPNTGKFGAFAYTMYSGYEASVFELNEPLPPAPTPTP